MKVILLQKVPSLGEMGEIKNVSDGYARNFLFPQKLAQIANEQAIKSLKEDQARRAKAAEKDLLSAEKIADGLSGLTVEIQGKASEGGKLYAAVTPAAIAKKLKERGFEIKKDQIKLAVPVKEAGEYPAVISLPHGLEAEITLIVAD